jgi:hypothetical protein
MHFDWMTGIRPSLIAGAAFWALGLYWGFSPLRDRLTHGISTYLTFDQEAGLSAFLSTLVFFVIALGIVALTELSLGNSWAVSWGVIVCFSGGIYEMGRRDGENRAERLRAKQSSRETLKKKD